MKLCPKCGQSFAEGFTYCPKDAAQLEKYDLRARIRRGDDFHFLLESESLITRLKREMASAFGELRTNPRAFLRGLLRGEGTTRQRKKLLRAGFASGLLVYASIFVAVSLIGLIKLSMSKSSDVTAVEDQFPLNDVRLLLPTVKTNNNQAKSGAGMLGGSLPQLQRPHGGGGADDHKRTSRGVPPIPSNLQLAQPNPEPPVIEHSTLVIVPTVIADPNSLIRLKGPVGMMDSPPEAPPSRGPGAGTGIGQGNGLGYGPGAGDNVGGGPKAPGGGRTTGPGGIPAMSEKLKPTILYRERAKYTEEARLNKVEGIVVLNIVFGADGSIHDIRTMRGLPYGLTETSIEAAKKIRFHPAVLDGKPVSVRATLEFTFNLY